MTRDKLYVKQLYKFLKQHHCLKEFIDNAINFWTYYRPYQQDKLSWVEKYQGNQKFDIMEMLESVGTIGQAFTWADTTQGANFWRSLSKGFIDYYGAMEQDLFTLKKII